MGDFDIHVGQVIRRFDRLEPFAHVVHAEIIEESRCVGIKTAGPGLEFERLGLGPLARALPFQQQLALVAVEHLSEFGLAGLATWLAPDECPVRILEGIGDVDLRWAVPESHGGRCTRGLDRE